jgi:hypothetical protein
MTIAEDAHAAGSCGNPTAAADLNSAPNSPAARHDSNTTARS